MAFMPEWKMELFSLLDGKKPDANRVMTFRTFADMVAGIVLVFRIVRIIGHRVILRVGIIEGVQILFTDRAFHRRMLGLLRIGTLSSVQ